MCNAGYQLPIDSYTAYIHNNITYKIEEVIMSVLDQARMYWRFTWGLRNFLKGTVTAEQSREIIKQRLNRRERNLLNIVKRTIYDNKASPYLKLLKLAGCEYGDFKEMVCSDGIEFTLCKLSEEGVYVSIEEFKGKKELIRGGKVFCFKERDFDNPLSSRHLETSSGASRSIGTRTVYDFDFLATNWAVYEISILDACGALGVPIALWAPIMPGYGPAALLSYIKLGKIPARWFSQVGGSFRPSFKSRFGTNYIVFMGRLLGKECPRPEYIPLDEGWRVAQWLDYAIKEWGGCFIDTYPSAAVRVCQAAKKRGFNITGTIFFIGGEPITKVKRKEIESTGSSVYPEYSFMEAGFVGVGCLNPATPDDVHFVKDSLALIQHLREVPYAGVSVDAFLFTTLLPSAPKVLFNVESGDYGVIEKRNCGCKFEELGFTDHIYNVRGFDKLTSQGMTFVGSDLVRIIEDILPSKFGGTSIDYQMVEEEDEQGHTHMSFVVSPEVGAIDENKLIQTVLAELGNGKDTQQMMAEVWSQSKTLRVKRMRPFTTARGKLLPLHIHRHR